MSGEGRRMPSLRSTATSLVALGIRALALLIIVELAGHVAVGRAFGHVGVWWTVAVAGAEALTFPAYGLIYMSATRLGRRVHVRLRTVMQIVLAGFGPVVGAGGFSVDRAAWQALEGDPAVARVRVSAVEILELAVLAPAASVVAIVLLADGATISGALLWPWAIGVPVGLLAAVWATSGQRPRRLSRRRGRAGAILAHALEGACAVRTMALHPRRFAGAWLGTGLYWSAEVCALYASLRATGLDIGVPRTLLAYATGYLASRRSLPLGGAGLTEALLVYSLYQLHEPLGPAIGAVLIYRAFNFVLVVIPSLIAYRDLDTTVRRTELENPAHG